MGCGSMATAELLGEMLFGPDNQGALCLLGPGGGDWYRWPCGPPGTARPRPGRAWAEACRAGTARPTHRAVPCQPTCRTHSPGTAQHASGRAGPARRHDGPSPSCRAGPTVPGQPSVLVGRPRHGPTVGPGQHGPDPSRAVPCLGRAKKACRGPGLRASGLMTNYSDWEMRRTRRHHVGKSTPKVPQLVIEL
uniref:Uncharacterized protein n=1 Tax=Oryza sativa subsp. japonica TaxID=39947 RepID=Q652R4_ORYSJ|nr:hypothetical protein [Oryza sativa Japonica Group]